ncbi:methyltransferase domain-containing protein [Streptomyces sp. MST-110588]|uniref:class I SAM-dependent methyltransferase n=1 Tax=Streptomyces sp. MST-110588 TaxID=2833628 RepID=UPI001F5CA1C7|nr:methyltransferase domain-containing protein [Streptomyces sp. MST-110588]UNO41659.1 methyltransferase domain-containing protein [Streptomyces sp. MST-110588]
METKTAATATPVTAGTAGTTAIAAPPAPPVLIPPLAPAARFLREAVRTSRATGAVAPSSRYLAARLAAPLASQGVARRPGPLSVLEAGAGTGPVTRVLAGLLGPADRLDAVEINPRFVDHLHHCLLADPAMAAASDRIRVIRGSITEVRPEGPYDVIVSCLPFTNFEPAEVRTILEGYMNALAPGGHLTFFGYLGTLTARTLTGSRAEAARHRAVTRLLAGFARSHGQERSVVLRNLPPARVWHLRVPSAGWCPGPPIQGARACR